MPSTWPSRLHKVESVLLSSDRAREMAFENGKLVFISFSAGVNSISKCIFSICVYFLWRASQSLANSVRDFFVASFETFCDMPV